jgi:hypothetical protein
MSFQLFTNMATLVSKAAARWMFVGGMFFIGLGFLVWILRELFAFIFTAIFVLIGIGLIVTAIKILWAQHRLNKAMRKADGDDLRQNVRIRIEE